MFCILHRCCILYIYNLIPFLCICYIACDDGYFGDSAFIFHCRTGICERTTGMCSDDQCDEGWMGSTCSQGNLRRLPGTFYAYLIRQVLDVHCMLPGNIMFCVDYLSSSRSQMLTVPAGRISMMLYNVAFVLFPCECLSQSLSNGIGNCLGVFHH